MKSKKALSLVLAFVMLCALLSGCVYVDSSVVIHDDCSGTVTMDSGTLAEEGEEPAEGQKVFEANGKKYYGTTTELKFNSAEEFNGAFAGEAGEESSEASADTGVATCKLQKNRDGSVALALIPAPQERDENDDGTTSGVMEDAYIKYSFTFDRPVKQVSGSKEEVTLDGAKVVVDLTNYDFYRTGVVFLFVTDVPAAVQPTAQALKVNGAAKTAEIYNINGSNYFKLRDIAALLNGTSSQFSVDYDAAKGAINVETGKAYVVASGDLEIPTAQKQTEKAAGAAKSTQTLLVNGESVYLAPYNIGGNNFFALRELGDALGFVVDYDNATATMLVSSK